MAFLCCDRFGCAWGSYVATELAKARGKCVATEPVYVAIEPVYVVTKLAIIGRISIVTEDFKVATELATIESSVTHDRAERAQVKRT